MDIWDWWKQPGGDLDTHPYTPDRLHKRTDTPCRVVTRKPVVRFGNQRQHVTSCRSISLDDACLEPNKWMVPFRLCPRICLDLVQDWFWESHFGNARTRTTGYRCGRSNTALEIDPNCTPATPYRPHFQTPPSTCSSSYLQVIENRVTCVRSVRSPMVVPRDITVCFLQANSHGLIKARQRTRPTPTSGERTKCSYQT
jgi:hypothetical protein